MQVHFQKILLAHQKKNILLRKLRTKNKSFKFPTLILSSGDGLSFLEDCDLLQIQDLKHLIVRSHIQAEVRHHKKKHLRSTKSRKRLRLASKPCKAVEDQHENQMFICLVFDPRGHLRNSGLSSLQDRESGCKTTP